MHNPCSEPVAFEVRYFERDLGVPDPDDPPPRTYAVGPGERLDESFQTPRPEGRGGLIVSIPSLGYQEEWVDPPPRSYRVFRPDVSLCPDS